MSRADPDSWQSLYLDYRFHLRSHYLRRQHKEGRYENEHYCTCFTVRRHRSHPWVSLFYSTVLLDTTCLNRMCRFFLGILVNYGALATTMLHYHPPQTSQRKMSVKAGLSWAQLCRTLLGDCFILLLGPAG